MRLDTDRIAVDGEITLTYSNNGPQIDTANGPIAPTAITGIWYRRPRQIRVVDEKQAAADFVANEWAASIDGFLAHVPRARWINHPGQDADAIIKLSQLTMARRLGLLTPNTLLSQDPTALRDFATRFPDGVVCKPLYAGIISGTDGEPLSIYTSEVHPDDLADLNSAVTCPTLLQERLVKDVDVRVTAIDSHITSIAMSGGSGHIDVRHRNMEGIAYHPIRLPNSVQGGIRAMMEAFGLRFGAFDFVRTPDGEWYFLEVNPGGQWAWLDLTANTTIGLTLVRVLSRPPPD